MEIFKKLSRIIRRSFFSFAVFAVIVFAVAELFLALLSLEASLAIFLFTLLIVGVVLWILNYHKGDIKRFLIPFSIDHAQIQYEVMKTLPFLYALVDDKGTIYWANEKFARTFEAGYILFGNVGTLFQELHHFPELDLKKEYAVTYGNKNFTVSFYEINMPEGMESADSEKNILYTMCMKDVTAEVSMENEIRNQRMVVGTAYLDNYEELTGQMEEVRMSMIIAYIDRKVTKYFSGMGGIVKKIEADKYFLALPQKNIEAMKQDHFLILDEIRNMKVGNDQHITMSIGLGVGEGSFAERYEYSRTAVEMALARGGDQAAIKTSDDIEYFGGSGQTVARNTRVKARVKAHALKELLMNNDDVLIMAHKIPDLDAIGSAVGVYKICMIHGKRVHIVLNEISNSTRPVVDRLNSTVAQGTSMFINAQEAKDAINENTLLIIVDTNRGSYTECPELLEMTHSIVVIDHHRKSNDSIANAQLEYVEPYASSASEMVTEILQYVGENIKLRIEEAEALYAGIVMDTNSFINKTGVRTFEAAAFLRRAGVDTSRVRKLFRENLQEYKARAEAVRNAEIYLDKFALSICPADGLESPTIAGAQAANELLDIKNVEASIVLTAYNDKIYLSARSIDSVNVQVIMEKLGGGGHGTMAGAQMTGCTAQEALEFVKVTLSGMKEKGEI